MAFFFFKANANADADQKQKEEIDKLNSADALVFQTEKQLKDYAEKLSEGNKTAIEAGLLDLKAAHQSQDGTQIDASMEKLNAAWQAASEEIYKADEAAGGQPGAEGAPQNPGQQAGGDDEVQDVDFEEVKEEK